MPKLKNKLQEQFCQEFLIDLSPQNAARRAGYAQKYANRQGWTLIHKTKATMDRINELMAEREKRVRLSGDRVLEKLENMQAADITDFVSVEEHETTDFNGNPNTVKVVNIKNTDEIDPSRLCAIASIKQGKEGIEIKLHDTVKVSELLLRHHGMLKDKTEVKIENLAELLERMKGSEY